MKHLYRLLFLLVLTSLSMPNISLAQDAQATQSAKNDTSAPLRDMSIPLAAKTNIAPFATPNKLMHRLNVRDFGTHRSMVANHSVETQAGTIGIRWYEFRESGSGWTLHQEGTYSPDSDDRWMGSISINANGDIALGYSRSSTTMV